MKKNRIQFFLSIICEQPIYWTKAVNLLYYKLTTEIYLMTNKLAMNIETLIRKQYHAGVYFLV